MSKVVIVCIRNRWYLEAANFIIKSILKEKIHPLGQRKRALITRKVAKMIKDEHEYRQSWYADMNIKPMEIAEEVYNDIMLKLIPESTNHKSLSEQLRDEK